MERASFEQRAENAANAIGWYRRAVAVEPGYTEAWLAMADTAIRIPDTAVALDATAHVLSQQPDNVNALVLAAIAQFMLGDKNQARELAQKARQVAPAIKLPPEIEALFTAP